MAAFTVDITGEVADFRSLVGGKRAVQDLSMLGGNMGVVNQVSGSVTVTGIPEVLQNWHRVSKGIQDACYEQMYEAAALIEMQSSIEVPYETGELQAALSRDEEEITEAQRSEGQEKPVRVYIYYDVSKVVGQNGESYAWQQHENLIYNHPTPGTKAKYLEDPFKEVMANFPELCRDAITSKLPGLGAGKGGPRLVKKAT